MSYMRTIGNKVSNLMEYTEDYDQSEHFTL